jgi:cold shock CspA family protein
MAKSQDSFNKRDKEKKRLKRRQDKLQKREERKAHKQSGELENMMAYVDENGNITHTPPDPTKKKKISASSIELGVPKREKEDFSGVRNGRVEFFNDSKGYGFIKELESEEKYFVHVTGLVDEVEENDKVTFELERGPKGMNAVDVKKV